MHWNWNDGWSGWNWALTTIGMIAFWALMVWAVVAFVRSPNRTGNRRNDSADALRWSSGKTPGEQADRYGGRSARAAGVSDGPVR